MDEDGFYVGQLESSGRRGLVPSNFLRELSRSNLEEPSCSPLNGGGIGSTYEARQKTPSSNQQDSRLRGASVSKSRLQSDDADLDAATPRRRRVRRTREVILTSEGNLSINCLLYIIDCFLTGPPKTAISRSFSCR